MHYMEMVTVSIWISVIILLHIEGKRRRELDAYWLWIACIYI